MANLGEFGAELARVDDDDAPEADTFTLYGHEFTVRDRISSLPALRYAWDAKSVIAAEERAKAQAARARTDEDRAAAQRAMAEVELTANAGLYAYLRAMIVPEEWERFESVAADAGLDDMALLAVASKIMEAVAGRPTRRSSGSPPGPSTTGDGSPDDSPSTPSRVVTETGAPVSSMAEARSRATVVPEQTPNEKARAEILDGAQTVDELRAASGGRSRARSGR